MSVVIQICCHGHPYNNGFHLIYFPKRHPQGTGHYELRECRWKMEEVIKEATKKIRQEKWSKEEIAWAKEHKLNEGKMGTS